jgi:DNA/RNA-binding domain of Phe-tRNA-synthetase-like protein
MIEIGISPEFSSKWPSMVLGCIECNVIVQLQNENLWEKIDETCLEIESSLKVEEISEIPSILSTRKAYRALGKDPARYRPSAEALMRRVVKGYGLYRVNNVVDIVNLVSLKTGFSIGGYDSTKIQSPINLSIGNDHDVYEGIGRGILNIEGLPVLRDQLGAFGSPTSDSVRTSVENDTIKFLMIIFGFGDHTSIPAAIQFAEKMLIKYSFTTEATNFVIKQ